MEYPMSACQAADVQYLSLQLRLLLRREVDVLEKRINPIQEAYSLEKSVYVWLLQIVE